MRILGDINIDLSPAKPTITNTDINLGNNQFASLTIEESTEDQHNELQSVEMIANTDKIKDKAPKPNQSIK